MKTSLFTLIRGITDYFYTNIIFLHFQRYLFLRAMYRIYLIDVMQAIKFLTKTTKKQKKEQGEEVKERHEEDSKDWNSRSVFIRAYIYQRFLFIDKLLISHKLTGDDQSEVKSTSLIMSPSSKSSAVASKKFFCTDDECCSCCITSTTPFNGNNNNNVTDTDKNHLHMSTLLGEDIKIFFKSPRAKVRFLHLINCHQRIYKKKSLSLSSRILLKYILLGISQWKATTFY